MSIVKNNRQENERQPRSPGTRDELRCFGGAVEITEHFTRPFRGLTWPAASLLVRPWNNFCRCAKLLIGNYAALEHSRPMNQGVLPVVRNSPLISNGNGIYLTQVIKTLIESVRQSVFSPGKVHKIELTNFGNAG